MITAFVQFDGLAANRKGATAECRSNICRAKSSRRVTVQTLSTDRKHAQVYLEASGPGPRTAETQKSAACCETHWLSANRCRSGERVWANNLLTTALMNGSTITREYSVEKSADARRGALYVMLHVVEAHVIFFFYSSSDASEVIRLIG